MTRQEKARQLRYKKAIVKDINLFTIRNILDEIQEECDEVQYWMDSNDETLINAMDGDEDDAYEFKMEFAELEAECSMLYDDLNDIYEYKIFDDIFVSIGGADQGGGLMGWDSYERDYFGLDLPSNWSELESTKRLERLTKKELLENVAFSFKIFMAFIGLKSRYDSLSATMCLIRDQNTGHIKIVKEIEKIYNESIIQGDWSASGKRFKELTNMMPPEVWL